MGFIRNGKAALDVIDGALGDVAGEDFQNKWASVRFRS